MLKKLTTKNVGPAPLLDLEFSERLNVLTGDNGLGKTFLLDVAWWALTRLWAGRPAWPDPRYEGQTKIQFLANTPAKPPNRLVTANFDLDTQKWKRNDVFDSREWLRNTGKLKQKFVPSSLVVYARIDEGFSVSDPVKRQPRTDRRVVLPGSPGADPLAYNFDNQDLWDGVEQTYTYSARGPLTMVPRAAGLYATVLSATGWIGVPGLREIKEKAYETLTSVLEALSPDPKTEKLVPGEPVRVSLDDVREIPTIDLPYGNVPVTYASAGMKRILSLAYVLVWTWYEHQQACKITKKDPSESLVLLIDEMDAHLHPKWQRSIVRALLDVAKLLSDKINTQIIATTHSPLILASMEPWFDETKDSVFVFDEDGGKVTLVPIQVGKYGDAASWLTSPVFGLHRGRSKEAERVLDAAYAFLRNEDMKGFEEDLRDKESIDTKLKRVLPDDDPFLVGWEYQTRKQSGDSEAHDAL